MARKKNQRNINHDIIGIILISLGLLMQFSLVSAKAGVIGRITKGLLISLLGIGAFVFPLIIIFIGICNINTKGNLTFHKKFYGIILFLVNCLLSIQLVYMKYNPTEGLFNAIQDLLKSESIFHGGIISLLINYPLYIFIGQIGCIIFVTAIFLISFILIFEVILIDFIKNRVSNSTKFLRKDRTRTKSDLPMVKSEKEAEKEPYIENLNKKIKIIDFMKNTDLTAESASIIDSNNTKNKQSESSSEAEEINKELSNKIIQVNAENQREYDYPSTELLKINTLTKINKDDKRELLNSASKLEDTLNSFGVETKVLQVTKGPSVTRYELQPSSGVKVSKIVNLSDDIALSLAAKGVRIEAPIPGKSAVGIEVPNKDLVPVFLREVLESEEFKNTDKRLPFALGKDIAGNAVITDLTKMPHLLIAGATGSGKSVCINTLIISLLYNSSPEKVRLLMVDPKVVELSVYNGIPHLLIPVVTDPKKAAGALNWAVNEMSRRYKLFAENAVRNIEGYNELFSKGKIAETLPWIVIIVDELADLMMVCPGEVEDYIGRLAQMARAAGMHLVIATQRPSVDVITGVIKANIPSRISFAVSSQIDSRTILDSSGAEKLLGKGDMLFYPVGESKPLRVQGAFIGEDEVEKVVGNISIKEEPTDYKEEILNHINSETEVNEEEFDELIDDAIKIVVDSGQASTSLIQRRLRIGYNRAARIMEQLEMKNIISGRDGSKPRQVLVDRNEFTDTDFVEEE